MYILHMHVRVCMCVSVYVYMCRPEIDIMYFPLSPYSLRQCLFNQTKLTSVASCWTVCSWDALPLPCEVRNTGELSRSPSIYGIQCLSSCCVTSALTPKTFPQFQSVVPDKLHQGHLRVCRNCSSSDPIPTERAQGAVRTLRMGSLFQLPPAALPRLQGQEECSQSTCPGLQSLKGL